jgi:hypothetical protein
MESSLSNDDKIKSLDDLHQDLLYGRGLMEGLFHPQSPSEKLANILAELLIWDQVWDQVIAQVKDQAWYQGRLQVMFQVAAQVGAQVWLQVMGQVKAQVKDQVWDQIWLQVRDQIQAILSKYDLASAFGTEEYKEKLRPLIHYTFLVYQLGSVVMRHSPEVRKIQADLAKVLDEKFTPEKIEEILNGLKIPESDDLLINTQLEFIRANLRANG